MEYPFLHQFVIFSPHDVPRTPCVTNKMPFSTILESPMVKLNGVDYEIIMKFWTFFVFW